MPLQDLPDGFRHIRGHFGRAEQEALVDELRAILAEAPLYTPAMPRTGKPMRVRMTNCGDLGWLTDRERGYRYQAHHPETGRPWPPIPQRLLELWRNVAEYPVPPQACLINYYDVTSRMGMHQDRDEADLLAPVISVSLGDACLFRIGRAVRGGPTRSVRLESGDVVVLGGAARLSFHGVDRIYPGTSDLLARGGRINLTLRRVTVS